MTRNGKIARLPRAVRHELSCRLSEGEPGASLVEWLNERDDVKTVLAARFGGRTVSEQTPSGWRAESEIEVRRSGAERGADRANGFTRARRAQRETGKTRINTPKHGLTRDNTG